MLTLTGNQSKVYNLLQSKGPLTTAEITRAKVVKGSSVFSALRDLERRGLAEADPGTDPKQWCALVPAAEPESKSEVVLLHEKLAKARATIKTLVVQNLQLVWSLEDIKR